MLLLNADRVVSMDRLAEDLGTRLLPVFRSPMGMPYMYVNLKTGKTAWRYDSHRCVAASPAVVMVSIRGRLLVGASAGLRRLGGGGGEPSAGATASRWRRAESSKTP